ncbi:UNVERIFIED_CONTAM: hypothetical protein HDU68_001221 [Siphonaria sp. JEL0065]|nr:hypothetical protein HDU68_001221 [Siphonaria sp. JEL0065]
MRHTVATSLVLLICATTAVATNSLGPGLIGPISRMAAALPDCGRACLASAIHQNVLSLELAICSEQRDNYQACILANCPSIADQERASTLSQACTFLERREVAASVTTTLNLADIKATAFQVEDPARNYELAQAIVDNLSAGFGASYSLVDDVCPDPVSWATKASSSTNVISQSIDVTSFVNQLFVYCIDIVGPTLPPASIDTITLALGNELVETPITSLTERDIQLFFPPASHFTVVITREFGFDAVFMRQEHNEIAGQTVWAAIANKQELVIVADSPSSTSSVVLHFESVTDGVYKVYLLSEATVLAFGIVAAPGQSTQVNSVGGFITSRTGLDNAAIAKSSAKLVLAAEAQQACTTDANCSLGRKCLQNKCTLVCPPGQFVLGLPTDSTSTCVVNYRRGIHCLSNSGCQNGDVCSTSSTRYFPKAGICVVGECLAGEVPFGTIGSFGYPDISNPSTFCGSACDYGMQLVFTDWYRCVTCSAGFYCDGGWDKYPCPSGTSCPTGSMCATASNCPAVTDGSGNYACSTGQCLITCKSGFYLVNSDGTDAADGNQYGNQCWKKVFGGDICGTTVGFSASYVCPDTAANAFPPTCGSEWDCVLTCHDGYIPIDKNGARVHGGKSISISTSPSAVSCAVNRIGQMCNSQADCPSSGICKSNKCTLNCPSEYYLANAAGTDAGDGITATNQCVLKATVTSPSTIEASILPIRRKLPAQRLSAVRPIGTVHSMESAIPIAQHVSIQSLALKDNT